MYAEELKIQIANTEAQNQKKLKEAEMESQLEQKQKELDNEQNKKTIALRIDYEAEVQKLRLAEYETAKLISAEEDRKKQLEFKH